MSEESPPKNWVKFEEDQPPQGTSQTFQESPKPSETETKKTEGPAVITPDSVHINIPRSTVKPVVQDPLQIQKNALKNVDLKENSNGRMVSAPVMGSTSNAVIRQGFANGEIIVTLLPVNTRWPWITPAHFRPELVPEELMAQGLTLTVEDYVQLMELLTHDVRFNLYNMCYKRILIVWIFTAFLVLLGLLVSGVTGLLLFGLGVFWLLLNVGAIVLCMWLKIKLNHNLEKCLAQVNKHFIRHKIILGLDDRGKISCHKVNLCFIYFDTADCIKKLQDVIDREEREGRTVNSEETREERRTRLHFQERMDIDDSDIIIQGSNTTRVPRKKDRGELLLTRYLQRWSKDYLRRRLDWTVNESGGNPVDPRHLTSALCPCQYIEEYLKKKSPTERGPRALCPCWEDWMRERGID